MADGALPIDALDTASDRIDGHTAGLATTTSDPPASPTRLRHDLAALTT